MPPVAPYQGYFLATPQLPKISTRTAWQHNVVRELFLKLPQQHFFYQHFLPKLTDWLPLYQLGYHQTTRYTHILPDISDPGKTWGNFEKRARNIVRKAERRLTVKEEGSPDVLFLLLAQTFEKQGLGPPYPLPKNPGGGFCHPAK